jgi:hypothetical protein
MRHGTSRFFMALFSFCVFVLEFLEKALVKFFAQSLNSPVSIYAYFILVSFFLLFIFTLFSAYLEYLGSAPFMYYGCVTNSCIYLFSAYTVTFIAAFYFSRRYLEKNAS